MSELKTAIAKIAKKYPAKGYEKKGFTIHSAYRDSLMSGAIPVFSFTKNGQPETTAKIIADITGYNPADCLNFLSEIYNMTKSGVISSALINPKLDVEQAINKKAFEKMKPGIVPDVSKNIKKIAYPIAIPLIIIFGFIAISKVAPLAKTVKKTL